MTINKATIQIISNKGTSRIAIPVYIKIWAMLWMNKLGLYNFNAAIAKAKIKAYSVGIKTPRAKEIVRKTEMKNKPFHHITFFSQTITRIKPVDIAIPEINQTKVSQPDTSGLGPSTVSLWTTSFSPVGPILMLISLYRMANPTS